MNEQHTTTLLSLLLAGTTLAGCGDHGGSYPYPGSIPDFTASQSDADRPMTTEQIEEVLPSDLAGALNAHMRVSDLGTLAGELNIDVQEHPDLGRTYTIAFSGLVPQEATSVSVSLDFNEQEFAELMDGEPFSEIRAGMRYPLYGVSGVRQVTDFIRVDSRSQYLEISIALGEYEFTGSDSQRRPLEGADPEAWAVIRGAPRVGCAFGSIDDPDCRAAIDDAGLDVFLP